MKTSLDSSDTKLQLNSSFGICNKKQQHTIDYSRKSIKLSTSEDKLQFKLKNHFKSSKTILNPVIEENYNNFDDDKIYSSRNLFVTFDYGFIDDDFIEMDNNEINKNIWLNSIDEIGPITFSISNIDNDDDDNNFEYENWLSYQPNVLENKSNFTVYKMQHNNINYCESDDDGSLDDILTSIKHKNTMNNEENFYDSIE